MSATRPPRQVRWRELGEWLRAHPGIHMVRRARCSCPVAEFIRDRSPYGSVPHVHHDRWWVSEWEGGLRRVRHHRTSPKIRDFVLAVDERRGDITGAEALGLWEGIDRKYGGLGGRI